MFPLVFHCVRISDWFIHLMFWLRWVFVALHGLYLAVAHGAPFMAVHGRLIALAPRGVGLGSRALRVTGCGTWA